MRHFTDGLKILGKSFNARFDTDIPTESVSFGKAAIQTKFGHFRGFFKSSTGYLDIELGKSLENDQKGVCETDSSLQRGFLCFCNCFENEFH